MSITNPLTITNRLSTLFNLLGVVTQRCRPITQKDDYGYNVTTELSSITFKTLPYNQNSDALEQLGLGDVDSGYQYFAVQHTVDAVMNDIIEYDNDYYLVEGVTNYTWGSVVMKALKTSKMTPPFPPYLLASESGESNDS